MSVRVRLDRIEAALEAVSSSGCAAPVLPMPPESWWQAFYTLLACSAYKDDVLGVLGFSLAEAHELITEG